MTIGQMLHQWLIKLDWFSTLFPRIPVPIQKQIEKKLADYSRQHNINLHTRYMNTERELGMTAANPANTRDGREYFDRNRDREREREKDRVTTYNNRYDHRGSENNRRYRSRSREKTGGDRDRHYSSGSSNRDHRDRDYYNSKEHRGEGSGDRRERDYSRDGEGSSSSDHYNSSRQRDKKYR